MNHSPHQNSDSQEPDVNSSAQHQAEDFKNSEMPTVQGDGNRVIQGDQNRAVQGDGNQVIQGDNNQIHTHIYKNQQPTLTRQEYRNRQALLTKVKNFWVKGVLEKSLYNQVLIELGLDDRPDAIASSWDVILETENSSPQPLPEGTKIIDIFDKIGVGRTLLILGEPGSGKTTTLLELTRDLIARAEQDINLLIPVVFHLSSWANKRQKIANWLVEELNSKYDIPKKIGQAWVMQQQLLALLDGLDEVNENYRDNCIAALNRFKKDHGVELVVCSRIEDYKALSNRLNFQSAVYIKFLTSEQICYYLDSIKANLTGLKALIQGDKVLQELAQSPLMLNIMTLVYKGVVVEDLPKTQTIKEQRKKLFDNYIRRMFDRPNRSNAKNKYSQIQTKRWLIWLAQNMLQESQTVFLIEDMHPYSLLKNGKQELTYKVVVGLISGLIVGLIFGLIFGLMLELIFGLMAGLKTWLIFGLSFGVAAQLKTELKTGLIVVLVFGLMFGLIVGLIAGLMKGLMAGLISGLETGLIVMLIFGSIISALFYIRHFALRLILCCNDYIPWNYAHFLDNAAERLFLQKVGGGYIFIHRMLLEHFAQMELE